MIFYNDSNNDRNDSSDASSKSTYAAYDCTIVEPSLVDWPAAPHAGISKCHAGGRSEGWTSGLGLSGFYWGSVGVILGFYSGYIIVVLLGFYWGSVGVLLGFHSGHIIVVLLGFYWGSVGVLLGYIAVILGVQVWSWKYVQDSWTSTCLGCGGGGGGVGTDLLRCCCLCLRSPVALLFSFLLL